MTVQRFNPLTYSNDLKSVGFTEQQSEKLAQLQEDIITSSSNQLVTKNDMTLAIVNLKLEIGALMIKSCITLGSVIIIFMTILKFIK